MAAPLTDGRHILSHVLVEPQGIMVATNGYAIAVVPCEITWSQDEERRDLVIPASLFQLAAEATLERSPTEHLSIGEKDATVTLREYRAVGDLWTDTEFPIWRKLFPDTAQVALDRQTIGSELSLALSLALGTTALTYVFTGLEKPILVLPLDSRGIGCIMPVKYPDDVEPCEVLTRRLLQWRKKEGTEEP